MPTRYGTSEHWLIRAKEARAMAQHFEDESAKRSMLEIAHQYENIAQRALAQRRAGREVPANDQKAG